MLLFYNLIYILCKPVGLTILPKMSLIKDNYFYIKLKIVIFYKKIDYYKNVLEDFNMVVSICVGSACHLKGSHEVITRLQELIAENNLENKVELMASFCLGNCANGVSMTINGKLVDNCSVETIDEIFANQIVALL